jgi:mono/diheme cytochrome c family protein
LNVACASSRLAIASKLFAAWWKILIALASVFVLMQFVPYRVDNPSSRDEPKWDNPRTRELVMRSCGDCHSNETKVVVKDLVAGLQNTTAADPPSGGNRSRGNRV